MPLRVHDWGETEFADGRDAWQALLARSAADPLFLSWDWCHAWWRESRELLGGRLAIVAVEKGGTLVGLAPLYVHRASVRGPLSANRLELIGVAWRDPRPAFSEYLDVIAARGYEDLVADAIGNRLLARADWDEAVLPCVRPGSVAAKLARDDLGAVTHVREIDPLETHCVDLPDSFDAFTKALNSDARRKLANQRTKRAFTFEVARERDVDEWLRDLHRFRAQRWGEAGGGRELQQCQRHWAHSAFRSGAVRLTRLLLDGRPVSVMLNARANGTEYYLQSGFDEDASHGVSLGYLHLGYAIERACTEGLARFDLLGGGGRNRDYKRDLRARRERLTCWHVVRSPWLRALHALHGLLGGGRAAAAGHEPAGGRGSAA